MTDTKNEAQLLTGFVTPKPSLLERAAEAVGLKRSAEDLRNDLIVATTKMLRTQLQKSQRPIATIANNANMSAGPFHRLDQGQPVTLNELVAVSPWIVPGMLLDAKTLQLRPDMTHGNVNVARPDPNTPVAMPSKPRLPDLTVPARSVMPVPSDPLPDKAEAAALVNILQNVADDDAIPLRAVRDGLRQMLTFDYPNPAYAGDRLAMLTTLLFNEQAIFVDGDTKRSSAAGTYVWVKADGVERLRRFC